MSYFDNQLLAINSANLMANLENVRINEEMLARAHEGKDDTIISLLTQILEELKDGNKQRQ